MNNRSLNIAGRLAEIFITSRLTILFIMASMFIGIIAITFTPREENPQITVPGAEVWVTLPGASAEEVEQLIIIPLEGFLREIPGVDHTFAVAMNSTGMVMVQFEVGENKEKSLVKLYDRVRGNRNRFPPEASEPFVRSVDVDDVPIITVTLASEVYNDYALKRLADRMMERLRSLEDVSVTYVKGGRDREIRVELNPERLQAFGVTLDQIQAMLLAGNLSAPVGTIVEDGKNHSVFLNGFLDSAEAVSRLVVGKHGGRPIYLEDVADVIDGPPEERNRLSRFAFGKADHRYGKTADPEIPAVILAVAKKPGVNSVFAARDILDRIERMKKNIVPSDVYVVITRNDGKKANAAVNRLLEHLGIAIFSVFVVIAIFLGIKEAVLVGIMVPIILALTLGVDFICGPTINRITMFGLILSMGIIVDASIVVIENIHRHYKNLNNGDKFLSAVLATNEIGNPTNLATFAVMLVFSSLLVVTGMMGQYFYPITFNVPVAMFISLLVAYIVSPWAASKWLIPHKTSNPRDHDSTDLLSRFFYMVFPPILNNVKAQLLFFVFVILLISASLLQPAWQFIRPSGVGGPLSALGVSLKMLPKDNKNTFNITIDMPEYTPVEITDCAAREIGELLRSNPYVTNYQVFEGNSGVIDFNGLLRGSGNKSGPHVAEIRVNLADKHERDISSIDIVRNLRPRIQRVQNRFPGSVIQLVEDSPGPPVLATVLSEIYGPDPEVLRRLVDKVSNEYKKTYDLVEVHDSEVKDIYQHRIIVDKEKAALSGITTAQIANALKRLIEGENLGRLHIQGEKKPVPIRLHVPRRSQIDPGLLSRVFITNPMGKAVPISELTRVIPSIKDRPILHKDNERMAYVGAELSRTSPVYAVLDLDRRLDGIDIGNGTKLATGNLRLQSEMPDTIDGYQLLWGGEIRLTLDMFRDMIKALAVALLFIYLLLVGYYRSFIIPLIAMASVPLGIAGVFPGHAIVGQPFTGASMLGVIALSGVVIRNSLLIIDFVIDNLKHGYRLRAAICEAGAVRLRPILLTALAVILGIAIMLTDPVFGGLAVSLIFGTIFSTALTMITVPLLIYILFRRSNYGALKE